MNVIRELIQILSEAPRMGSETDQPEGNRYIAISDTLAKKIVSKLNAIGVLEDHQAPKVSSIQDADLMYCGGCGEYHHYIYQKDRSKMVVVCANCKSETEITAVANIQVDWGVIGDGMLAPSPIFKNR